MKMLLLTVLFIAWFAAPPDRPVGMFKNHLDIGKPKLAGGSTYNTTTKIYTMQGAGYNIWFNRDEFQYAYNKVSGDFKATAHFKFLGGEGNGHRKVGWMIRASEADDDIHASAVEHGDGLTVLQWRVHKGENMKDPEGEIFFPQKIFEIVEMERNGKKITMRVGHPGQPLQLVGSHEMPNMPDNALVGVFICSHDSTRLETAEISEVKLKN